MNNYQKIVYFLAALFLSAIILTIFIRTTPSHLGINQFDECKFTDLIKGSANKPYVTRLLLPQFINVICGATPQMIQNSITDFGTDNSRIKVIFDKLGWETEYFYQYMLALLLMLTCFIGVAYVGPEFLIITSRVANTFLNKMLLLFLTLLLMPGLFKYASYLYDPPQLFLFVSCLYFLVSNQPKRFLIIFLLLCINKETAIVLIPLFVIIFYKKMERKKFLIYFVSLCVIYCLTRTVISLIFINNGGSFLEFHLMDHNRLIIQSGWNFQDVFFVGLMIFFTVFKWKEKHCFLKTSFMYTFIPLASLAVFFGYVDEWRMYYEVYFPFLGLSLDTYLKVRNAIIK